MPELRRKVILLLGPTSVGKTSASILLAKELGTEIISADSMQIYKHMDIGTAKPTEEELNETPHHMISIVHPGEEYSAGRYMDDVVPVIEKLHARGKLPLIVGGTGLYVKSMTRGLFNGPSADSILREDLIRTEEEEPGSLYALLERLDPESAFRITRGDLRRIVRALEVCYKSNSPISELRKKLTAPLPYEFIKLGLTRAREELYDLIEKRVDEMFQRGLLEETERILSIGPSKTALQAIGYKELAGHIRGERSLEEAQWLIKRNTKRYAKRQFTWFKKEEGIKWVDVTGLFGAIDIYKELRSALLEISPGLLDGKAPHSI